MAFTLDAKNNGTATGIALTVAAGAKLVVATFAKRSVNDPTGVTFGGQAMTRRTEYVNGTALGAEIWYLVNPPTGAQTLAFTITGSVRVTVASYTVAAGTSPAYDTENGGSGTSTGPSDAVTPSAQPNLIVTTCVHESSSAMTGKGTGQLGLMGTGDSGFVDEGVWNTAATYEPTTSTGSDTQSFTNGTSDTWAIATAVFKEVPAPQTVNPAGRTSASSFGTVTITTGNANVAVAGRTSASSFGTVTPGGAGPQTVAVAGRTSASGVGTPTILVGGVTVYPAGHASLSAFGAVAIPGQGERGETHQLRCKSRLCRLIPSPDEY